MPVMKRREGGGFILPIVLAQTRWLIRVGVAQAQG